MENSRRWCFYGFCMALILGAFGGQYQTGDDRDATKTFEIQVKSNKQINMTRYKLSGVSSTVMANAPDHLLNRLSRSQLAGVGDSLKRSRNTRALNTLMTKLDKENSVILANEMAKSPKNLTKNARVNLLQDLIIKLGEPATWTSGIVQNIGEELLKGLNPSDVKNMAAKNTQAFEALAEVLLDEHSVSRSLHKAIGDGAKRILGKPDKWDQNAVGRFAKFSSPKYLRKMSPFAVSQAVDKLAKLIGLKAIQAQELVKRLSQSTAFGNIEQWNGNTLKRLGHLALGLTTTQIKSVRLSYVFNDAKEELGKVNLTNTQARQVVARIKQVHPMNLWSADQLKKSGNLTKGLDPKDFGKLQKVAIEGAMETLKTVSTKLSLEQRRRIAEKFEEPFKWTNEKALTIGNLCFGKTAEELKKIQVIAIEGLLDSLQPETTQVDSQKRALKSKFFSLTLINLRKAGPLCEVFTLSGLKNTDVEKELGLANHSNSTWLPWRIDQASQLVEKIKALKGEPISWDENTITMLSDVSLLRGLSRDDISKISLSNFTLEQFSDDEHLLDGQKTALIKAFESKRGFAQATLGAVESMGGLLINAETRDLERMSRDLGLNAVLQMGGVNMRGRPYGWVKQRLQIALDIMRRDFSQLTSDDVVQLGNLVCGMTSSDIKELNNEVFNDTMEFLGERACFNSTQLKALADKTKEVFKKEGQDGNVLPRITAGELLEMGCIIEGFSPNDLSNLSQSAVRDNIDFLGAREFSAEQAKAVMEKLASLIDFSSLTGDDLIMRGNTLLALSPSDIITVNYVAYDEAASAVGKIDGYTREQLEAWANKAKQAWYNNVAQFTASHLLRLGAVAIGFGDNDLRQMALSTDDVIQSLGSQKIKATNTVGYSSSQLKSALSRIKDLKNKFIYQFTSDEISNLNNFAVAMTTKDIDSIHKSSFLSCIGSLGRLKGWSVEQMKKLKEKAIEAHGKAIDKWSPAHLREAGSIIGGFTASELESLSAEHIAMVTSGAIESIPPSLFSSFTSSQLRQFDSSQAAAVTNEQMKELSSESKEILERKIGDGDSHVSGVQQVSVNLMTLVTVMSITAIVKIL